MNISNITPQESAYTKSDSSATEVKRPAPEIKQYTPVVKQTSREPNIELSFGEKMEQADKREKIDVVIDAIDTSNKSLKAFDRKLELSVHQGTNEVMIKVIDTLTDEVIREIPSEKVLDTVAHRKEALGILMDQKI